jgi:hypothetical protein
MNKINKSVIKFFNKTNFLNFIILMIFVEVISVYLSYKRLFDYEQCTNILEREFHLFGKFSSLNYPEMCDESYYFHGFQWVHHIYQNGFVYQDRPMYLFLGFAIYNFIFVLKTLIGYSFDPTSLLLLSTLIYQLFIINFTSYALVKMFSKKFDRLFFLIFFLIIVFSFEIRRYLFLPSSSNFYFLIFTLSLYSIKTKKLNGFMYGCLITISGYGIIGYIYQLIPKLFKLKNNLKDILKNTTLIFVPTIFFEILRILMGLFKGPGYGVRYIYNAEFYQQFIWFFKSLFYENFIPATPCQEVTKFLNCYLTETKYFLNIMLFPTILFAVFVFFHKYKVVRFFDVDVKNLFLFTIFSYFFILFQGIYSFRIIYYSLGFLLLIYFCIFFKSINNPLAGILFAILMGIYNLSRSSWAAFNLNLTFYEWSLLFLIFFLLCLQKKIIN